MPSQVVVSLNPTRNQTGGGKIPEKIPETQPMEMTQTELLLIRNLVQEFNLLNTAEHEGQREKCLREN